MEISNIGQLLGGSISIGIIGSFIYKSWDTIVAYYKRLSSFLFVTHTYHCDYLRTSDILFEKLIKECKVPVFYDKSFRLQKYYFLDKKKSKQLIAEIEHYPSNAVFLPKKWYQLHKYIQYDYLEYHTLKLTFFRFSYNKKYFLNLIDKTIKEDENKKINIQIDKDFVFYRGYDYHIYTIKGSGFNMNQLKRIDTRNESESIEPSNNVVHKEKNNFIDTVKTQRIKILNNPKNYELAQYIKTVDNVKYTVPEQLIDIEKEVFLWLNLENFCAAKQITWKKGYILTGNPGNGKTSFVRYIAEKYDMPLYIFMLSTLTANEFIEQWINVSKRSIILFEDFDSIFNGRERVNKSNEYLDLTFDVILQAMDGVEQKDGRLLFLTTNNLDKIDEAIKNRKGRIDKIVEVNNPSERVKREIAKNLIGKEYPDLLEEIDYTSDITTSTFKHNCLEMAYNKTMDIFSKQIVDSIVYANNPVVYKC